MELNQQLPEQRFHTTTGMLELHHCWETIQGEGPYAGTPAVFVRFTGCNLQCPLCDTEYTSRREVLHWHDILTRVQRFKKRLVVLTGGEPFRQPLAPFIRGLINCGYQVQVETNGTLCLEDMSGLMPLSVVCSPKTPMVHPMLQPHVSALKYVVRAGETDDDDGLPINALGNKNKLGMLLGVAKPWSDFNGEIYIQPADEDNVLQNKYNLEEAVRSCMRFGYRLCLQMHKIAGLE